jgi:hypothetical protein
MSTFKNLQDETLERLEEVSTASLVVFTLAELKEAINEGYADISERTEWNEVSETVSVSTQYVDIMDSVTIDTRLLSVSKAYNNASAEWLRWTTWKELDARDWRWDTVTGTPEWMFLRGLQKLGFYPTPTGATNIDIFYTKMPTPLAADGDTPGFPDQFHRALVHYALYDLLSQDGETGLAVEQFQEYEQVVGLLETWMNSRMIMARDLVYGNVDYRSAR